MILAELFPYWHIVYRALTILYVLTVLSTIVVVISENRNPVKSLAWVTVLLLLPVAGLVLYVVFGRSLKNVRMISRRNQMLLASSEKFTPIDMREVGLSEENRQHVDLVRELGGSHYFPDNQVEVFTSGAEKFEALKRDLKAAKQYIHLQYYIFEDDDLGNEIADLLIDKASQGVRVRVIYDHVGSYNLRGSLFKRLRNGGVQATPFLKVSLSDLASRINWRNHRKVVVIDGEVGYIGGMNIADRYVKGNRVGMWRDTHMRIVGEAVNGLNYSFAVDWNISARELISEPTRDFDVQPNRGIGVQIITSGPNDRWSNQGFQFLRAIGMAKKCVYVQTPYFLPNNSLLQALQVAALSGIDVRVMMPRNPDSVVLRYASYSYVKECLEAGVKIYMYEPGMLHAKMLLVDDEFCTSGSTNFDFRSFEHNFECNAVLYGKEFNSRMKQVFADDERQCTQVSLEQWQKRSIGERAVESVLRMMGPIL